ncbi:MAG: hypothetical protein LBI47_02170 [Puniceicoccales bacterium]|jgi:hypothetical protein|nr:hypothetical protein [Puniceicoccales bacterium]
MTRFNTTAIHGVHLNKPVVERFKQPVLSKNPSIDPRHLSRKDSDILANELFECGLEEAHRGMAVSMAHGVACRIWQAVVNVVHMVPEGARRIWQAAVNMIHMAFITPKGARRIWQATANKVAADCFDEDGKVDVVKLRTWMNFLENVENLKKEPFRSVPHAEFMCSQMHRVCECLLNNQNAARDLLDAAAGITVGRYGRSLLAAMSNGMESPLKSSEAILASLLAPHRQWSLPTCTINSLINAEIQNHPERLIPMYMHMLDSDQFTFPSGYALQLQPMVDGYTTIDLKNGGYGRNDIFESVSRHAVIAEWRKEGIEYVKSADEAEKYKLKMPVHNMNDVLFAHFFQVSGFGNNNIDFDTNYGTMLIYAGHKKFTRTFSAKIQVDGSNFLAVIAELKAQAEAQRQLKHRYMRVSTKEIIEVPAGEYSHLYHSENIDIDALLDLDPNNMETGKAYPIGDRNWGNWKNMSQDIPRLVVRKKGGTPPTFEFGTLERSTFEEASIIRFRIYSTDVEVHDAQYWAPFMP